LNVIDGIDYKDIAIQYNIPLGTVKSRVFRAKKLLQEKYREISFKYEDPTV
jgi:DNA-directed RNA polymerase specialized sigma24 family protein